MDINFTYKIRYSHKDCITHNHISFLDLSYDEAYFYCLQRAIIPIFYGKCNNKSESAIINLESAIIKHEEF